MGFDEPLQNFGGTAVRLGVGEVGEEDHWEDPVDPWLLRIETTQVRAQTQLAED